MDRARPLRVAGQSLDEEIDDFTYDHMLSPLMLALVLTVMAALEWWRYFHDLKPNPQADSIAALVGPKGVFTIETKTLSKPERGPCKLSLVGGTILANGNQLDRNPLVQAKAQAGWTRAFLKESRFDVHVWPVVLFPGWFVEPFDVPATGAWVLEPKALSRFVENEPDRLSRDEVKAIGSAITSYIRAELGRKG